MPPLTGYESEDEWQRKTNANYGQEWRQGLMILGMIVGALLAGWVMLTQTRGMPMGKVRLLTGVAAFVGIWGGAALFWCVGYMLDSTINGRARRKRGDLRVRVRGKGKKRRYDLE